MIRRSATAMTVLIALSGCAVYDTEYSCKGYPEGVTCKSFQEVYDLTSERDVLYTLGGTNDAPHVVDAGSYETVANANPRQIINADFPMTADPTMTPDYMLPIRTPPGVMRILIFTYEDKEGDLNAGRYVFTEMEQSRWFVGESVSDERTDLYHLDVQKGDAKDK